MYSFPCWKKTRFWHEIRPVEWLREECGKSWAHYKDWRNSYSSTKSTCRPTQTCKGPFTRAIFFFWSMWTSGFITNVLSACYLTLTFVTGLLDHIGQTEKIALEIAAKSLVWTGLNVTRHKNFTQTSHTLSYIQLTRRHNSIHVQHFMSPDDLFSLRVVTGTYRRKRAVIVTFALDDRITQTAAIFSYGLRRCTRRTILSLTHDAIRRLNKWR